MTHRQVVCRGPVICVLRCWPFTWPNARSAIRRRFGVLRLRSARNGPLGLSPLPRCLGRRLCRRYRLSLSVSHGLSGRMPESPESVRAKSRHHRFPFACGCPLRPRNTRSSRLGPLPSCAVASGLKPFARRRPLAPGSSFSRPGCHTSHCHSD